MSELKEVQQAIRGLYASEEIGFGMHLDKDLATGVPGLQMGEEQFDPFRHSFADIDPMSTMETMLEMPHVPVVVPMRPLEMNVVLHQDPADLRLPRILRPVREYKESLAAGLHEAVSEGLQATDDANLYIVGSPRAYDEFDRRNARIVPNTETPQSAAQAVADIARRGLTIVVSDFSRLPLEGVNARSHGNIVAVKANHRLERELPAGVGRIALSLDKPINTNKPKELMPANAALAQRHQRIIGRLAKLGIGVASVTYDHSADAEANLAVSDPSIARAIQAYGNR